MTGHIYTITNIHDGMKYVGQTTLTIEERYKAHCIDAKKEKNRERRLYHAMNEYGYNSFLIEEIETVDDETLLDSREIFWIEELRTFENGYNETKGGKGTLLYDHEEIIRLYQQKKSIQEISNMIGSEESNIRKVLRGNNIKLRGIYKPVKQFDLDYNYIRTFDNPSEARDWLIENNITSYQKANSRICECCKNKRKSIYGYRWEYSE